MPIRLCVSNSAPRAAEYVPPKALELFQSYTSKECGKALYPFEHQSAVFQCIERSEQVRLVAGTASGKTLAIAVPLFTKLRDGELHHVLFMYPTVGLLEDQRRVMDTLAEISGLEVGELRGGMSRSRLIASLTKPVIVATPDEVYWFFRRNVKYSGLLIYGLCQIDDFVLDEAHLFNGLMLRNVECLWERIKTLATTLGRAPRLHVLTATPAESLERLSGAPPIAGRSKCGDVHVELRPSGRRDRAQDIAREIDQMLETGCKKTLVVCNSARTAHRLFEEYKVDDTAAIPIEHRLRFGKVTLETLSAWLGGIDVGGQLVDELAGRLSRGEDVALADVPEGTLLGVPLEELVSNATEALERQCSRMKRALCEHPRGPGRAWESALHNHPLSCYVAGLLRSELDSAEDLRDQQGVVDRWLDDTIGKIGTIDQDPVRCRAPEFTELADAIVSAGVQREVAVPLVRSLTLEIKTDPSQVPLRGTGHRLVYLRWLDQVADARATESARDAIKSGLQTGELDVECRHIGVWRDTDVPVIVYSGSMARQARAGLIDVFRDLDRAVLVSTSAVEVGVDFHADVLITEECDGNSFLQRFGRVGRDGDASRVVALLSGDTYSALSHLDGVTTTREDFSSVITRVFPQRNYAAGSQLLDASHYLVNEQLGRIGGRVNAVMMPSAAGAIAHQLREAEIEVGFGLRSTMPQIALRDGVSKSAFYVLQYVDNSDLLPSNSPFLIAGARTSFTSLIFRPAMFDIMVDLEETLKASRHLFIWDGSHFSVRSQPAVGRAYLQAMCAHFQQFGGWVKLHPGNFLLLHGDIYLSRVDRQVPVPELVRDSCHNPIFIANQTCLLLFGWTDPEETHSLLQDAKISDWEELYYDWDRLRRDAEGGLSGGMVILENMTGACFAAYRGLLDHVNRQV